VRDIDLPYELRVAAPAARFAPEQIHQAPPNAVKMVFLENTQKAALRPWIEVLLAG
jgi:adenosine deaminase